MSAEKTPLNLNQEQQALLKNKRNFSVFTVDQARRLNAKYDLIEPGNSIAFFADLYTSFEQDEYLQMHLESIDDELFQSTPEPEAAKEHYTTALMYALLYTEKSLQCSDAKALLKDRMQALKDAIDPHVVVSLLGQHQEEAANDPTSLLKQDIFGQGHTSAPTERKDLHEAWHAIDAYLITEERYAFDGTSIEIKMTKKVNIKHNIPIIMCGLLSGILLTVLIASPELIAISAGSTTAVIATIVAGIASALLLLCAGITSYKAHQSTTIFNKNFDILQSYRAGIANLPNVTYQTTDSAQPKATAQHIICTCDQAGWHHNMQSAFAQSKMLESPTSESNPVSSPSLQGKSTSREKPPQQDPELTTPTASSESKL